MDTLFPLGFPFLPYRALHLDVCHRYYLQEEFQKVITYQLVMQSEEALTQGISVQPQVVMLLLCWLQLL